MLQNTSELIIERGNANPRSNAFHTIKEMRDWAEHELGMEAISHTGECDDIKMGKIIRAVAKDYMAKIPWAFPRTDPTQGLCFPIRCCPHTPSDIVPDQIIEASMRLCNDVVIGYLDPLGRKKPIITKSVSTESVSVSFERAQALTDDGGLQVRSKDPLYAVRHLISPWIAARGTTARLIR